MKRVLVTGAGGFIGHHLVKSLLDRGDKVTAFLRYTSSGQHGLLERLPKEYHGAYSAFLGDIRDHDAVRKAVAECDVILHLAALIGIPYSYESPTDVAAVNIGGTLNVLQAARQAAQAKTSPPKVVITSTSEVYGSAQSVPITEDHPLNAQSPYAATKIAADQLALSFYRSFELPVTVCRPFNTFGPGQSQRAIIPTIMVQALQNDRIEIGSTFPTRDLNYVKNTVDAFLAMADSEAVIGRVVQFGTNREIAVGDLAKMILKVVGKAELQITSTKNRERPKASEVERLVASYDLAKNLLSWVPKIGLEEGLKLTYDWIRDNSDFYHLRGYAR